MVSFIIQKGAYNMKQAGDLFLARVGPWVFIFLVIATLIVSVAMPVQVADRRNDTCRDFGYDGLCGVALGVLPEKKCNCGGCDHG